MRALISALVLLFAAAAPVNAETIAVDSPRWQFEPAQGGEARVADYQGKHALYLHHAAALLPDANFNTGVIEFDMAMPPTDQSFPGVMFRGVDEDNFEHFYLRAHQNRRPDASQYTPVVHGEQAWQIFSGPNYDANISYRFDQWFHVKLEIAQGSARVYVDSETPTLVIHDLKGARQAGWLALDGSAAGAYFANITVTPGEPAAAAPEPAADLPPGLVRTWDVSPAMAEADAFAAASGNHLDALHWTKLPVETNGIALLQRVVTLSPEAPTVLTHVTVHADAARSVPMRFGFSDRARVYVNGVLLYAGNHTQYSQEPRYLGIVGFFDTLQVPLRRGDNQVVLAVSETNGGWAANAAFPEMTGLQILTSR